MHADIAVEDMTHENYWRQLMRWLVDGVPDHVEAHTSADRVEAGETVTITADVVDPTFVEINDARAVAHVEGPKGIVDVPLQWTGERSGEYRGSFVAPDEGLYTARVEATRGATALGTGVTQLRAAPGDAEYFDAGMNAARLQRIADDTGGQFYKASAASRAGGRHALLGARRDDDGGAGPVAHADRAGAHPSIDVRGVGISAGGGVGVEKGEGGTVESRERDSFMTLSPGSDPAPL